MARRIGILTSGGDCAGLNAVIAGVVTTASNLGYECIGFEKGWEGLLSPLMYRELTPASVQGIVQAGGTILRTANRGRFGGKKGSGDLNQIPAEILDEAFNHLKELNIEGLIVIGGDGTLAASLQLADRGVNIVGVPKTIDNDLSSTDRTFGFSTAVQVAVDAIDKIHTTAASHDRTFFIETMGRYTGWIALNAGLAGDADCILIPEVEITVEQVLAFMRQRRENGHGSNIIVIAEGVTFGGELVKNSSGKSTEVTLGGVSEQLMRQIETLAPDEFEMRHVVLGHTQRGGSPNAEDRILALKYGTVAMQAYHEGKYNQMVSLKGNQLTTSSIADAVVDLKRVTPETPEYQAARAMGTIIA